MQSLSARSGGVGGLRLPRVRGVHLRFLFASPLREPGGERSHFSAFLLVPSLREYLGGEARPKVSAKPLLQRVRSYALADEVRPEGKGHVRDLSVHGDHSAFVDETLNDIINASAVCAVDSEPRQLVVPVHGSGLGCKERLMALRTTSSQFAISVPWMRQLAVPIG